MKCDQARERLAELAVGALDEPTRSAVQAHLDTCSQCRLEYNELLATGQLLDATPLLRPSRDLWPEVAEALRERKRAEAPWWQVQWLPRPRWALASAAAAAAATAAIILAVTLPRPTPPEHPPLPVAVDEDAALFAQWNAGASLEGGFADARSIAVLLHGSSPEHEEADVQ